MKKILLVSFALMAYTATITSCKKDDNTTTTVDSTDNFSYSNLTSARTTTNNTPYAEPANNELSGTIKTNTILKTGKTYSLKGFVYIIGGATLKIEPGVIIKGDKDTKGTLIVTRNGMIDAQGTAASPIVFTSAQASPAAGDWGGIILLGNSKNNGNFTNTSGLQTTGLQVIEGGVNNDQNYAIHGGTDVNDNSGTMKYVRIEYPGVAFQPNNEINGLTFGSVGEGTKIDYIEVYRSGDDSYEWFGGTVNAKHLIAAYGTDDDFDTDNGFSGKVQFGIGLRDPQVADQIAGGASNGFESDNDASGTTGTPTTMAVFSNMTLIGPKANSATPASNFARGAHIRRNSSESILNSMFVGWKVGIRVSGALTSDHFRANEAQFMYNILINNTKIADTADNASASSNPINPSDFFYPGMGNNVDTLLSGAMLSNLAMGASFDPTPTGGLALSGASFTSSKLAGSFFTTTSYRGAVGAGDTWFKGWTKW